MFGGRFMQKSTKPLSASESRAQKRAAEYARLGLTTYRDRQRHEDRKVLLGEDYHDRFSGTWREAEETMKKSHYNSWWDWLVT